MPYTRIYLPIFAVSTRSNRCCMESSLSAGTSSGGTVAVLYSFIFRTRCVCIRYAINSLLRLYSIKAKFCAFTHLAQQSRRWGNTRLPQIVSWAPKLRENHIPTSGYKVIHVHELSWLRQKYDWLIMVRVMRRSITAVDAARTLFLAASVVATLVTRTRFVAL